jgi:hypothetical protein
VRCLRRTPVSAKHPGQPLCLRIARSPLFLLPLKLANPIRRLCSGRLVAPSTEGTSFSSSPLLTTGRRLFVAEQTNIRNGRERQGHKSTDCRLDLALFRPSLLRTHLLQLVLSSSPATPFINRRSPCGHPRKSLPSSVDVGYSLSSCLLAGTVILFTIVSAHHSFNTSFELFSITVHSFHN